MGKKGKTFIGILATTFFGTSGLFYIFNASGCDGNKKVPNVKIDKVSIEAIPELDIFKYADHYYSLVKTEADWAAAERTCENMGGHLATITSNKEQGAIESLLKQPENTSSKSFYSWIGAQCISTTEKTWKWVTGEEFSYTYWASGEPNNSEGSEVLLDITSSGYWNDDKIESKRWFICEWDDELSFGVNKPLSAIIEKVNVPELPGINVYKENNHYYSLFTSTKSFTEAEQHCEELGGHLATIANDAENQILYKVAFNEGVENTPAWIGMERVNGSTFRWITNENVDYTNWGNAQPDNSQGKENAVHYQSSLRFSNAWNDRASTDKLAYFCEWEENATFGVINPVHVYKAISTGEELVNALSNTTGITYLTNDIYLPATFKGVSEFAGYIDGNGHTIYTPTFNPTVDEKTNFIHTNKGTLKNLTISVDIYTLDTFNNLSGFVLNNSGTIENVTLKGDIYAPNVSYIGGFFHSATTNLKNLVNEANITGKDYVGGIAGNINNATIIDSCSNTGTITGKTYVGGIIGYFKHYTGAGDNSALSVALTNLSNTGEINGESYLGGICGYAHASRYNTAYVTYYPTAYLKCDRLANTGDINGRTFISGLFGYIYANNGSSYVTLSSSNSNITGACYVGCIAGQASNVRIESCSNQGSEITINDFELDSGGFKMSYVGGYVGYGYKVKDCDNATEIFALGYCAGGIAGALNSDIENCNNIANISAQADYIGGVVGSIDNTATTILNCSNSGDVTGKTYVGGVFGHFKHYTGAGSDDALTLTVKSLTNTGAVIGEKYVAGIFGYVNASRYNTAYVTYYPTAYLKCDRLTNTGDVSGRTYVSGLFGYVSTNNGSSYVTLSSSKSSITGTCYVGCIAGYSNNFRIESCSNQGSEITIVDFELDTGGLKMAYVGGYLGLGYCSIKDCDNAVEISAQGYCVGGIAGSLSGNLENCNNIANISANANSVGGIVGRIDASTTSVVNCSNSGKITGKTYVGGIFGYFKHYTGAGNNDALSIYLKNLVNTGEINGDNYVAGICGYAYAARYNTAYVTYNPTACLKCERFTNTGSVTASEANPYIGGYFGYAYASSSASYIVGSTNTVDGLVDYTQIVNITDKDKAGA